MDKNKILDRLPKEYNYSLLPNHIKIKSYVDIICDKQ